MAHTDHLSSLFKIIRLGCEINQQGGRVMVYGDESIPSNYLIEYTCTADTDFLFVDLNFRETRNVCKNFILNDQ